MNDLRECPVEGCTERHKRSLLMCRSHWYQVPKNLRDELWAAYKHSGVLSERYLDVRESCIEAVEP
jgi:hypothetical protein